MENKFANDNQNKNGHYESNKNPNENHLKPQNGVRNPSHNKERNQYYNGYNHDDKKRNSSEKSQSVEIGRTIRLLRNGDPFYRGHKFVISSRSYRFFEAFMDSISDTLNANFGAIRKIYTTDGHRIRSLDELQDSETYVAAGLERFIRLNYLEISEGIRQAHNKLPALSRDYQEYHVSQYDGSQSLVISVFRNGDMLTPSVKILLYKNSMVSFEAVLNEISLKVSLLNGPILKLYKMDGDIVFLPHQLENGNFYVAASREKFKDVDYGSSAVSESIKASFVKSPSKDLPPVKTQFKQVNRNNNFVRKNPKTKVNFNKMNDDDIFKLGDSDQNNNANIDHNERTYNKTIDKNDSKHNKSINNNNVKSYIHSQKENNYVKEDNDNINNNKINNIVEHEIKSNFEVIDHIEDHSKKSFREKEDEELQLNYQKISDDDLSEINSTADTKNEQDS